MKHGMRILSNKSARALRSGVALASVIALTLFAFACKNGSLDAPDSAGSGTGSVTVRVAGNGDARLVMPTAPDASTIARYDVTCARVGYANMGATGLTDASALTVNGLAAGEWSITIDAFDGSGTKVATGLANVTIVAGTTAAASVTLSPVFPRTAGGTGTVSLVFACSGFDVAQPGWEIVMERISGGTTRFSRESNPSALTVDPVSKTIALNATLVSGDWDMSFTYSAVSGNYVTATTVVKVYDGKNSVNAAGGAIPVSLEAFFKADRVRYVSNSGVVGKSGKTRAQACTLQEAIDTYNGFSDLTESDPGVIILTENVIYTPVNGEPSDFIYIKRPMKIMSLESAPSPFSISASVSGLNTLIQVDHQSPSTGSLTLEKVIVQPGGPWGYEFGIVQVYSTVSPGTLTLNAGATIRGNQAGQTAGGVFLISGRLVMNTGSEISGNKAYYGAGVMMSKPDDVFEMKGGSITGNTAIYAGGGVYAGDAGAKVELKGGTVTGNAVTDGTNAGPGSGICLFGETAGSLTVTASGGWSAVVRGNTGVGPDLVRQVFVSGSEDVRNAIQAPHTEPVWIDAGSAVVCDLSLMGPGNTAATTTLSSGADIVLAGSSISYTANNSLSSSNKLSISDGTLWIDVPIKGHVSSSQPIVSVTGGKLVLEKGGSLRSNGAIASLVNGGAVFLSAGSFEMRGGEIYSCNSQNGGAVYVSGPAEFIMSGGTIRINNSQHGGGVCLVQNSKMTMSGSAIVKTNTGNNYAGGVCVMDSAELAIVGSTPRITGNNGGMDGQGGNGVLLNQGNAKLTVSGTTWPTIINGNTPAELPSLVRVRTVADQIGLISALGDTSIPVCVNLSNTTVTINTTVSVKGIVVMNDISVSKTLQRSSGFTEPLVSVDSGGSLTLQNYIAINGNKGVVSAYAPLVAVQQGGSFAMSTSTVSLQDNRNLGSSRYGGALYVAGSCTLVDGAIGYNESINGGAVCIAGTGTMTMNGGAIGPNSATQNGGGVYIEAGGSFNLYGGAISQNSAVTGGGGLYIESLGICEYTGGKLFTNDVSSGEGGAIYTKGTFRVKNAAGALTGFIYSNSANAGGGLYAVLGATVSTWDITLPEADWTPLNGSSAPDVASFSGVFQSNNTPGKFEFLY